MKLVEHCSNATLKHPVWPEFLGKFINCTLLLFSKYFSTIDFPLSVEPSFTNTKLI